MLPTNQGRRGRPRKTYETIIITPEEYFRQFSELSFQERERKSLEGISRRELTTIKVLLQLDYATLAKLLNITERTIHGHASEQVFSPIISDKIMGILEVYNYGFMIIGDMQSLYEWMFCPNSQINYSQPINMLRTHSGLLEVRALLTELSIQTTFLSS